MDLQEKVQQPVTLRKRRERVKSKANWKLFFYMFNNDFAKPDLIWTHKVAIFLFYKSVSVTKGPLIWLQTREELREALENEMRLLNVDRELTMNVPISWNHAEFEVRLY